MKGPVIQFAVPAMILVAFQVPTSGAAADCSPGNPHVGVEATVDGRGELEIRLVELEVETAPAALLEVGGARCAVAVAVASHRAVVPAACQEGLLTTLLGSADPPPVRLLESGTANVLQDARPLCMPESGLDSPVIGVEGEALFCSSELWNPGVGRWMIVDSRPMRYESAAQVRDIQVRLASLRAARGDRPLRVLLVDAGDSHTVASTRIALTPACSALAPVAAAEGVAYCPSEAQPSEHGAERRQWRRARRDQASVCATLIPANRQIVPGTELEQGTRITRRPEGGRLNVRQALTVYVTHLAGQRVEVTWGGVRGTRQVSANVQTGQGGEPAGAEGTAAVAGVGPGVETPRPEYAELSTFYFATRAPGTADLVVRVVDSTGKELSRLATLELDVEPLYWGAMRLGLGASFAPSLGRAYTTETVSTMAGNVQEIVRTSNRGSEFELVVGFAPYLFDVWAWGGRSHQGGRTAYFAPYVGFGLVGSDASVSGPSALTSIHFGMEVEVAPVFSIAVTAAWRPVVVLGDGYAAGDPVASGATYTEKASTWAVGVIINAAPSFLNFARGSSESGGSSDSSSDATEEDSGSEGDGS